MRRTTTPISSSRSRQCSISTHLTRQVEQIYLRLCVADSSHGLRAPRAQERLQPTAARRVVSPVRLKEVAVSELRALHRGSRQGM